MNASVYRRTLAAMGLSHSMAAELFGCDERTSRRWAEGKQDIPRVVENFSMFLIGARIPPARALEILRTMER